MGLRLPVLCLVHKENRKAENCFQIMCLVLCRSLVGQKSKRTRGTVQALPCGTCHIYLAHRMGDEYAQKTLNVEKKELPDSYQVTMNTCRLELGRGLLSDQIWENFHMNDIICILDIKAKLCKISNPCLKAWRVWSISFEQK